jgi:DNA-binding response OmpR family regulator
MWSRRGMTLVRLHAAVIEQLLAEPPDVIVLDRAAIDPAVEFECWQVHDLLHIPIVIVAGTLPSQEVVALLERGAEEVVAGPPDAALLAACVAAILRRRGETALRLPVLRLPGVEIDMVRRVVHRADTSRSLSRTEFSLLVALLRAGGRACSHHELLRQVWHTADLTATPYLRLYIRYLREKIEDDPRRPRLIVNVWGRGYRLALGRQDTPLPDPGGADVRVHPAPNGAFPSVKEVTCRPVSSSSARSQVSRRTSLVSQPTASP